MLACNGKSCGGMQASSQLGDKLQLRLKDGEERMLRMSALPTWLNLLLRLAQPVLSMSCLAVVGTHDIHAGHIACPGFMSM